MRKTLRERLHLGRVWDLGDTRLFSAAVLPAVIIAEGKNGRTYKISGFDIRPERLKELQKTFRQHARDEKRELLPAVQRALIQRRTPQALMGRVSIDLGRTARW